MTFFMNYLLGISMEDSWRRGGDIMSQTLMVFLKVGQKVTVNEFGTFFDGGHLNLACLHP